MLNDDGGPDSEERQFWWKMVRLRGKQYVLLNGSTAVRFVHMLAEEMKKCTAGRQTSEHEFLFMSLILRRDDMVTKARDIRPLLARRMDLWEAGRLPELLHQAQRCDQQRKKKANANVT